MPAAAAYLRKIIKSGLLKVLSRPYYILSYSKYATDAQRKALSAKGLYLIPDKMTAKYLRRFKFNPDIVVDVGVSEGTDFLYELFPNKKHVLVEPQPNFMDAINKKFGTKYDFDAIECAAGEAEGSAELVIQSDNAAKSTLQSPTRVQGQHPEKTVSVKIKRLDDILASYTGTVGLKVDTEGHDLAVLKGAIETLQQTEFVICEVSIKKRYENGYTASELIGFMADNGFEPIDILNPSWRVHLFWDVLFIKRNSDLFNQRGI